MHKIRVFTASIIAVLMVACGGGSGNGSQVPLTNDQNPPTVQDNNVLIPEDNLNPVVKPHIAGDGVSTVVTTASLTGEVKGLGLVGFVTNKSIFISSRSRPDVTANATFIIQEYDLRATDQRGQICTMLS